MTGLEGWFTDQLSTLFLQGHLSLLASIYIRWLTTTRNSSSWGFSILF